MTTTEAEASVVEANTLDVAVAESGAGAKVRAQTRRARTRVARTRASAIVKLQKIGTHLVHGATWTKLPPLLDSRPRSLREQRDVIRAHRFDRPSPTRADVSKWRIILEHVYDGGMWVGFIAKALFMTCEWCVERPRRIAVASALTVALIHLF